MLGCIRHGNVIFKDQELWLSWSSSEITLEDVVQLTVAGCTHHRKIPLVAEDVYLGMSRTGAMLMGTEQEWEDSMEDSQLGCPMK